MREQAVEAAFHWRPATLALRLAQDGEGLSHSEWRALLLESAAAAAKIGSAAHEEELRLAIADALLLGNASEDAAAVLAPLAAASGLREPVAVQTLPALALDDQDEKDLRWTRGDFIESGADFGAVVVHGHTIRDEVEERANRIGIDTGAYATGRLTALGLEGSERWLLST